MIRHVRFIRAGRRTVRARLRCQPEIGSVEEKLRVRRKGGEGGKGGDRRSLRLCVSARASFSVRAMSLPP